jgi:hypothetical protein
MARSLDKSWDEVPLEHPTECPQCHSTNLSLEVSEHVIRVWCNDCLSNGVIFDETALEDDEPSVYCGAIVEFTDVAHQILVDGRSRERDLTTEPTRL